MSLYSKFRMNIPKPDEEPPRQKRNPKEFDPTLNPTFANVPTEAEQPSGPERLFHVLWEVAKTVAAILLAALFIRAFVIQPFFVQGESMDPSFRDGDYLLVNQVSYHFSQPKRGDVVIFKAPPEPETNYIKRVAGMPGETVELKNGKVIIRNSEHPGGVALDEPFLPAGIPTKPESDQLRWEIGPDEYFVLGDNRHPGKSSDSRAWGLVPKNYLIGRAWLRVYPIAAIGTVQHPTYPNLASSRELEPLALTGQSIY